mgnify:CR=1 FL=1
MIVVSNAEPYKHEDGEEENPVCREVGGGLTTAMNPQMKKSGGVWIAYGRGARDFDVVDSEGKVQVPDFEKTHPENQYTLQRLNFPDAQYHNFYRGYANQILWPVFHSFPTKAEMERENRYWEEGYLPANKKYAEAVIEAYEEGDTVWVHDYHLALVPRLVRKEIPQAKIGVFWHIPWPSWENFGKIPHREKLLQGLGAADLIGLHIQRYVDNFLRCVKQSGGKVNPRAGTFRFGATESKVDSYPLGVDFDFFNGTDTGGKESQIREQYNAQQLILGVDRQDYTKGIPERLRAYQSFLGKYSQYRGRVSLLQRTPPSRTSIPEYQREKRRINEQVSEFNGKVGDHNWTPINLFWGGVPQSELIAEYRAADLALVTPGLDGMNLVAKEFIASNPEPKVLILSEFAGSSQQLEGALKVNPYNTSDVAEKIKEGLEMHSSERRQRWKKLRESVKKEDLPTWARNFLRDLEAAYRSHYGARRTLELRKKDGRPLRITTKVN